MRHYVSTSPPVSLERAGSPGVMAASLALPEVDNVILQGGPVPLHENNSMPPLSAKIKEFMNIILIRTCKG